MKYSYPARKDILRRFENRCAYCGCKLNVRTVTMDHVYPHCKGGTRARDNIMPCCAFCNHSKADNSVTRFKSWIKKMQHENGKLANEIRRRFGDGDFEFYFERLDRKNSERQERLDDMFVKIKKGIPL